MLEEFMGIPAHPLLVHFPVVLVPLLALVAAAYALIAVVRPHTRWVLGLLAIAAPVSAILAVLSGNAFFDRLDERGQITEGFYPTIEAHQQLGLLTMWSSIPLGLLTLALVYFVRPAGPTAEAAAGQARSTRNLLLVLRILTVVAAAVSLYYVIRTGDSGAKAVWTGS